MVVQDDRTASVAGKRVLLIVNQDDERHAFTEVMEALQLTVIGAETASYAMELLEDNPINLLVMDIQPPDMHGWQFLSKVKEVADLRDLPVIVIADRPNLSPNVENVIYLMRPVSIARLRQYVVDVLQT